MHSIFVSASSGPIFANPALTAIFVATVLSFPVYYFILRRIDWRAENGKQVIAASLIWLAGLTFEFYFLGPYSFVEQTTEGNLSVAFDYYLTHFDQGGRFSHQYGGGQDVYTLMFGKHFFNPERFFFAIFPVWIAVLLHKIMIGAIGFAGAYLLADHVAPARRTSNIAIAAFFTVCHYYLLNWSTNWSPGFSVLPLVIYLCVARSICERYWFGTIIATIIFVPSDPIHLFPVLTIAVVAALVLLERVNFWRVALSFVLLLVSSVANWHEVLYAFQQNVAFSSRIHVGGAGAYSFFPLLVESLGILASTMPFVAIACVGTLIGLVKSGGQFFFRSAVAITWCILSIPVIATFPWHLFGLGLLNRLSFNYYVLSLLGILPLLLARTLASLHDAFLESDRRNGFTKPAALVMAGALALLSWNKLVDFGLLMWFGGQANLIGYQALKDDHWKPTAPFRIATILETPNANVVAGMYGLDTYDGQLNLAHIGWDDYWKSIVRRDPKHILTTRTAINLADWNGHAYDVERTTRLDLLGVANVRFLLSPLPLKSSHLKLVSAPAPGQEAKKLRSSFPSIWEFLKYRWHVIFRPGRHYVYELPEWLPRVFAAATAEVAPPDEKDGILHDRIARAAFGGAILVAAKDAAAFANAGRLKVVRYQLITDGYGIDVDAPAGGILVINNMYVPFWQAHAENGQKLRVVPADADIHTAISVPPGTRHIQVLYRRPLLREKIAALFAG